MSQSLLFVPLHLLGLALCLAIGPRRRPALCSALGFPVGLAAAVLLALAMMLVGVPDNPSSLGVAMAIAALAAAFAAARRGVARRELAVAAWWTAGFVLTCPAVTHFNVAILTSIDSHRILSLAIMVANDGGIGQAALSGLGPWGVFQVVAHSMMGFTQRDFLYSLPLVMGLTFIPVFAITLWHALGSLGVAARGRSRLVVLVTVGLFTIGTLDFHFIYIHTNLGAAIYLFVFVTMLWIGEVSRDDSFVPVAFLALIAFAFHRTETPLVALLFLALMVTQSELPRRSVTLGVAAFSAAVVTWYEKLAAHLGPSGDFLTPARCHMIAALAAAFPVWWLASALPAVQRINRRVPLLVAAACVLALIAAFATRPDHMLESARNWAVNLMTLPLWGYSWFLILALALVGLAVAPPPFRQAFAVGLPACFAFVLFLVYFRVPYRYGRGDSANRMTVQFLPLIMFYLAIKFIPALWRESSPATSGSRVPDRPAGAAMRPG